LRKEPSVVASIIVEANFRSASRAGRVEQGLRSRFRQYFSRTFCPAIRKITEEKEPRLAPRIPSPLISRSLRRAGGLNKNFAAASVNHFSEDFPENFFGEELLKELKLSPPSSNLIAGFFGALFREGRGTM